MSCNFWEESEGKEGRAGKPEKRLAYALSYLADKLKERQRGSFSKEKGLGAILGKNFQLQIAESNLSRAA